MLNMNGLIILQCKNEYKIFTQQNILVAHIGMPPDGFYIYDAKALEPMTKVLAKRWGVNNKKK